MTEFVIKPDYREQLIEKENGVALQEFNTWMDIVSNNINELIPAFGTGSPEGVLTANVGKLYIDTGAAAGTGLYIKETGAGNTGWILRS